MFTFIRQSSQKLRLWLIAVAAVVLLTSVLEAGHAHGALTATDDNCTLCQHSVALDKILNSAILTAIPLVLMTFVIGHIKFLISHVNTHPARIRAPPLQLHIR